MYAQHIAKQVKLLHDAGLITDVDATQKALEAYWADRVAIVWDVDDVLDRAKDLGVAIDSETASDILKTVHHRHDASRGVSWDTFDDEIIDRRSEVSK